MSISDLRTKIDDRFMARLADVHPHARYAMLHAPTEDRPFLSADEWKASIFEGVASEERIEAELAKQLGGAWSSFEDLPAVRRLSLLLLEAQALGDRCVDVIEGVNRMALLDSGVDAEKMIAHLPRSGPAADGAIVAAVAAHWHVECVSLAIARRGRAAPKALPATSFLWLKAIDRRMWLLIDAIGRTHVPVEVAGVFVHAAAEIKCERKLEMPEIKGLASALVS